MTRELNAGVEESRRRGLSSWKRRKWARWLVPNWASKPSAVSVRVGRAIIPALLMRMLRLLLFDLNSLAASRVCVAISTALALPLVENKQSNLRLRGN